MSSSGKRHPAEAADSGKRISNPLSFLWLELTNRCNLQCTHCYAESGPGTSQQDTMSGSDYERLICEASDIGCRQLQFIGGEPTMNRDLPRLVQKAARTGYDFIEVFTNLTLLSDALIGCFKEHRVHVATSVYAAESGVHDRVTRVGGSFERTVTGLRRLLTAGIPVRAGIVAMSENSSCVEATVEFLHELGVKNVGVDRLRRFGRGALPDEKSGMEELCGSCADSTLCIAPDGGVSPCIMSKTWSIGSCRDARLRDLVHSDRLQSVRNQIRSAVSESRLKPGSYPDSETCFPCGPDANCPPCAPNTSCDPTTCRPYRLPN